MVIEVWISAAVLVAMNVVASARVVRENQGPPVQIGTFKDDPSRRQRAQLLLVWLLPLVGALIVWALYSPRRKPPSGPSNPDSPHPYIDGV